MQQFRGNTIPLLKWLDKSHNGNANNGNSYETDTTT